VPTSYRVPGQSQNVQACSMWSSGCEGSTRQRLEAGVGVSEVRPKHALMHARCQGQRAERHGGSKEAGGAGAASTCKCSCVCMCRHTRRAVSSVTLVTAAGADVLERWYAGTLACWYDGRPGCAAWRWQMAGGRRTADARQRREGLWVDRENRTPATRTGMLENALDVEMGLIYI
jgi:hypothetical protein